MERKILGIELKNKINNAKIRKTTKCKDIGKITKKLKFKYAGHMARTTDREKWNKPMTEWIPYNCKRRKGRSITRWRDEIRNRVGWSWRRIAENRTMWRKIGEAYAREWAIN